MQRRDLIALLSGVFSWPFAAHAQQKAMPVIGYLSQRGPTDSASIVAAFRQGLREQGYVEGQNVIIESRFAEGQINRLPGLASDLVRHGVNVFVATGGTGPVVNAGQWCPTQFRSYSRWGAIRSSLASSPVWHDRATTSPGWPFCSASWCQSKSNCSTRSCPRRLSSASSLIQTIHIPLQLRQVH
jgi:hypothetical protein